MRRRPGTSTHRVATSRVDRGLRIVTTSCGVTLEAKVVDPMPVSVWLGDVTCLDCRAERTG